MTISGMLPLIYSTKAHQPYLFIYLVIHLFLNKYWYIIRHLFNTSPTLNQLRVMWKISAKESGKVSLEVYDPV